MIISAVAAKIKQIAVITFIGIHSGIILLKSVMLNTHPARLRILVTKTTIMDIHIVICSLRDKPREYQCGLAT